jgi:hypothetical protein
MEATYSSKRTIAFQHTMWHYIVKFAYCFIPSPTYFHISDILYIQPPATPIQVWDLGFQFRLGNNMLHWGVAHFEQLLDSDSMTCTFTCLVKVHRAKAIWNHCFRFLKRLFCSSLCPWALFLIWRLRKNGIYPCNRLWRPIGLWDVKAPTFPRHWAHKWQWGYQPYTLGPSTPRKIPGSVDSSAIGGLHCLMV